MTRSKAIRRISILDTTLRDGEQAPGNSMSPEQKLKLAIKLQQAGVDTIETGFPASSSEDFHATKLIAEKLSKSNFATFSRSSLKDVKAALDAGGIGERHILQIVATGSDLHLKHKRNITREQGVKEVVDAVNYARSQGVKHISVGVEDASRGAFEYMKVLIEASITAGADQIILADTTGFATPKTFYKLIKKVRGLVGTGVRISNHCHNDLGMALANAISGIEAGSDEVQVTLGGIGERAGNTSLEQIVSFIYYKGQEYGIRTNVKQDKLYEIYNELRSYINLKEPRTQPIFGKYAFGTAAGIHQQGIINNPDTYEYVKPKDFARNSEFFVSRHSGRSILRFLLKDVEMKGKPAFIDNLYKKYIANNSHGYHIALNQLRDLIMAHFPDLLINSKEQN